MIRRVTSRSYRGGQQFDSLNESELQSSFNMQTEFATLIGIILLVICLGMLSSCGSSASSAPDRDVQDSAVATQDETDQQKNVGGDATHDTGIAEENSGMTIEGIPDSQIVSAAQLFDIVQQESPLVIDLRPAYAYDKAHIEDAVNIPAGSQLEVRADEIPVGESVYLIDLNGTRVAESWQTLADLGLDPGNMYVVSDGMQAWMDNGYPTKDTKDTSRRRC